jgi:hypothetical protein
MSSAEGSWSRALELLSFWFERNDGGPNTVIEGLSLNSGGTGTREGLLVAVCRVLSSSSWLKNPL